MNLDEKLASAIKSLPPIAGIAPNAFSRVIPADFLENYSVVCFKWRGETSYIAQDLDVFSVEKEFPSLHIPKVNAKEILSLSQVQDYLKERANPWLLVYKPTSGVEKLAEQHSWNLIANKVEIKEKYENKRQFRQILEKAGVDPVPGESFAFDELNKELFGKLQEKYGNPVVFQVAELTVGGGTGTAFVGNDTELEDFVNRMKEKREKFTKIKTVNATKYLNGIPASIVACVTGNGVITASMQTQIQDIPDVRTTDEGSGLFLGHDWSFRQFDGRVKDKAADMARKLGEYMMRNGYKGIFGMDLIVEEGEVYPIECNPRYTDAFPIVSQMHEEKGLAPLDLYHILEFAGADYEADTEKLSSSYANTALSGAQIILETKTQSWTKTQGEVKAGIYEIKDGELEFLREGYRYDHLKSDQEFLVTEGVPFAGTVFKPGARVVRLVFKKGILQGKESLTEEARNVIQKIYEKVSLSRIEPQEDGKN